MRGDRSLKQNVTAVQTHQVENILVFKSFLNCVWLSFTRSLVGRLFHRVGPAHAKALRPKRSKVIRGTSRRSPLEDRRHRFGVCWFSSEARYTGSPS